MHDIWNPWHGCIKKSEGCDTCGMRLTCNGCSSCGKCEK